MKLAALLLPLLLLLPADALASSRGPATGELAPALLGTGVDGKPVTLDAWRGKLVVVAFWNSACQYCRGELPNLEQLQQDLGDARLQVVAVNVSDDSRDYKAMLRQMRDYALVQARDQAGTVAAAWGVQMFPNLWLVDGQGRVLGHHEGYFDDALPGILDEIRRAAAGAASPAPPR